mgnify:CR=1 FL=1
MIRRFIVCSSLFLSLAVTIVGCDSRIAGKTQTPQTKLATTGCFWVWVGPITGWVLDSDNCKGNCDKPAVNGKFQGDEAATPCKCP